MLCKMRLRQISVTEKLFKRATLNSTRFASVIHLGKPFCPWTLEKELLKLENRSIRYTIFDWSNCQSNYQLLEIKYTNVGKIVIEATIYNPNIEDCKTFGFSNKLLLSFEFVINSKSETCNKNTFLWMWNPWLFSQNLLIIHLGVFTFHVNAWFHSFLQNLQKFAAECSWTSAQ